MTKFPFGILIKPFRVFQKAIKSPMCGVVERF